jgi:hypothetical protein
MPQRRRRQLRRNFLVFLGSLIAHTGLFFLVVNQFHFYPLRYQPEEAVQVELVPQPVQPIPPIPIPPPIKPVVQPTPKPPTPPPTPQAQPTPPKPQPPTPARATPQPVQTPTAPVAAPSKPIQAPAPKPTPAPTPLAPPTPAPTPGPPRVVSQSAVVKSQAQVASTPKIVLHKAKDQGAPLAPAIAIPGATFAPPTGPAPSAAAPSGGGAPGGGTGLPGGALPGFGGGLRGSALGCANAEALHFTAAEKARCAQQFGEGARESPQMSAIDASKRQELDHEAASAAAAQKYRDSTPAGSEARPVEGQPRLGHSPSE